MADLRDIRERAQEDEKVVDIVIYQEGAEPYRADDGTPCTMGLVGQNSKEHKRRKKALVRKLRLTDPAEHSIATAAAMVVRWHGWTNDGEPFECTPENAFRFLASDVRILNQVWLGRSEDDADDEDGRDFSDSGSTSSSTPSDTTDD